MQNDKNIGLIKMFSKLQIPNDYLECDGSAISRTVYWELFNIIGVTFGEGNGEISFNLPDLRGQFIRGWDHGASNDPDAAVRVAFNSGNSGDAIGSIQDYAQHYHKHVDSGHRHTYTRYSSLTGSGTNPNRTQIVIWFYTTTVNTSSNSAIFGNPTNSGTGGGTPRHGNETRPANFSTRFCIKYQ